MIVQARLKHLKGVKPHEWALRFVFGGLCTMLAGLIAKHFGPVVGGLFLAFPAIFPASASLIEKHEIMHKQRIGTDGQPRGRTLAGIDAAGTALACCGLMAFAAIVWKLLPMHASAAIIALATLVWLLLSVGLWLLRKSRLLHRVARHGNRS
jgi:hypothetical protein